MDEDVFQPILKELNETRSPSTTFEFRDYYKIVRHLRNSQADDLREAMIMCKRDFFKYPAHLKDIVNDLMPKTGRQKGGPSIYDGLCWKCLKPLAEGEKDFCQKCLKEDEQEAERKIEEAREKAPNDPFLKVYDAGKAKLSLEKTRGIKKIDRDLDSDDLF